MSWGPQFLPFDLFNDFPAFSIKLDIEFGVHNIRELYT